MGRVRSCLAAALLPLACMLAVPAVAVDLDARFATADSARGKKIFRKCAACHTVDKGGRSKIGPNLWGIVGSFVGVREGFRYSSAMAGFGGSWTLRRLDDYLANPSALVKGGSMSFVGLKRANDRADVIAFLNEMSDNSVEFAPVSLENPAARLPDQDDVGILFPAAGASETIDACTPCHSELIVAQQGLTRKQWDEALVWMTEEQGMEPIEDRERSIILDYLAKHYGPDRPNFPRN